MNIKKYDSYIKENSENKNTFRQKYSEHIENGDIKILRGDVGYLGKDLLILVKSELEIPEFKNKFVYVHKYDGGDYKGYTINLPMEFGFDDIINFSEQTLSNLLKKTSTEIKSELQSMYNKQFGKDYFDKSKIVSLFKEYYSSEYRNASTRDQDRKYYSKK